MPRVNPVSIWRLSIALHRRGHSKLARVLKALNFIMFGAVLPPEALLGRDVTLGHYGSGVVIHPNATIGNNVHLWHRVTLAVSDSPGSVARIIIGDDVEIGAGAVVISRERESITIASNVKIGANAVVARSIKESGTYVGVPAQYVAGGFS